MNGISIFMSTSFNQLRPFDSNIVLHPDSKIVIKSSMDSHAQLSLYVISPFHYIINHFFLTNPQEETITIHFNEFFPSGRYQILLLDVSQSSNSEDLKSKTEYYSFQLYGSFTNFNWSITYAVSCVIKNGMDIRLAAPKQNFPFFLVESLEGKPVNTFTTDVWSTWLLYDSISKIGTNSIMFGFRSVVYCNYIIFGPESLINGVPDDNPELVKYLYSEQGIETSDELIKNFAEQITAKTTFGIIQQALYLITEHLSFKDQLGEFGAKYALLNRQGDCTEYSALFTALCRVKKLPSRLIAGLKRIGTQAKENWIRHAWSEVYYNGLWIPIDVVEGKSKIIGYHPNLIPLFKGNWMTENMNRELKISVLDEYKDQLSSKDLVESYSSLSISYKVQQVVETNSKDDKSSTFTTPKNILLQVKNNAQVTTELHLSLEFDEIIKNTILGVYFKADTVDKVKSPKLVQYIEQMKATIQKTYEISVKTPEYPGEYKIGVFLCSPFGEMISLSATNIKLHN